MTLNEWPSRLAITIAQEIQRHRKLRGMSAQQLSDACTELGLPLSRSALANLESGRRPLVAVSELLVIAKALGVPPVLLAFPLGAEAELEILPGRSVDTWEALKWFVGEQPFTDRDPDVPGWYIDDRDYHPWKVSSRALGDFRVHEEYTIEWRNLLRRTDAQKRIAEATENPNERKANRQGAEHGEARMLMIEKELGRLRADMREHGLVPPQLEPLLAHVDQ